MEYRTLGGSGLKVSTLGLGANQFGGKVDQETVRNILGAALDLGVNFIDTAGVYQGGKSEECIGAGLHGRREATLIATKFFGRTGEGPNTVGASRYHILRAVEGSLRRLNTDYIDLYQIHQWDSETPLEETMRALDDLIASGKVRYIGASNFAAWQLTWANALAELNGWSKFVSIQPHFHMFERGVEKELIPACAFFDIGILPYFPLAGGFLTGKYRLGQPPPPGSRGESSQYVQRYMTPENFSRLEKLKVFAEGRGHQVNELAHAWLLAQPQVSSVISGATKVEQVLANAASVAWKLTPEEISEIRDILGST